MAPPNPPSTAASADANANANANANDQSDFTNALNNVKSYQHSHESMHEKFSRRGYGTDRGARGAEARTNTGWNSARKNAYRLAAYPTSFTLFSCVEVPTRWFFSLVPGISMDIGSRNQQAADFYDCGKEILNLLKLEGDAVTQAKKLELKEKI